MTEINKKSFTYRLNQHTFGERTVLECETVLGYALMTFLSFVMWATIFIFVGNIVYYSVLFPMVAAHVAVIVLGAALGGIAMVLVAGALGVAVSYIFDKFGKISFK